MINLNKKARFIEPTLGTKCGKQLVSILGKRVRLIVLFGLQKLFIRIRNKV